MELKVCASSKAVIGERAANAQYGAGLKNKLAYDNSKGKFWVKPKMVDQLFIDLSAITLPVVAESESDEDVRDVVETSNSAEDTANAEARDEASELEDSKDHLLEWEA